MDYENEIANSDNSSLRLNITPTTTPSRKRPRTDSESAEQPVLSTAKGSIHISECESTGKFIKLANKGDNVCIVFHHRKIFLNFLFFL